MPRHLRSCPSSCDPSAWPQPRTARGEWSNRVLRPPPRHPLGWYRCSSCSCRTWSASRLSCPCSQRRTGPGWHRKAAFLRSCSLPFGSACSSHHPPACRDGTARKACRTTGWPGNSSEGPVRTTAVSAVWARLPWVPRRTWGWVSWSSWASWSSWIASSRRASPWLPRCWFGRTFPPAVARHRSPAR